MPPRLKIASPSSSQERPLSLNLSFFSLSLSVLLWIMLLSQQFVHCNFFKSQFALV